MFCAHEQITVPVKCKLTVTRNSSIEDQASSIEFRVSSIEFRVEWFEFREEKTKNLSLD